MATTDQQTDPDSTTASSIIETDRLYHFFGAICALTQTFKLTVSSDGISVDAIDGANAAQVTTSLRKNTFKSYFGSEFTVGIDADKSQLMQFLKLANNEPFIELSFNLARGYLELEAGPYDMVDGLIPTDGITETPGDVNMGLKAGGTISTNRFSDALDALKMVDDEIELTSDGSAMTVKAEHDDQKMDVTFDGDVVETIRDSEATAKYDLGYLADMEGPMPSDETVTLTFDDELPMRIEYTRPFENGPGLDVNYQIAPRQEPKQNP